METDISEPFLLSSYATPQRLAKSSGTRKQKLSSNVSATYEKTSSSLDGFVTVTAQVEGVHVIDVSTIHSITSHTLGPSTTFSCSAVTLCGADKTYTTYAAIESSTELNADENGKTIWMWQENTSGGLADRASQKRKSVVMPYNILGLYTCSELASKIIVQSQNGDLSIIDADLQTTSTRPSVQTSQPVLNTFVYPRKSCSFLSPTYMPSLAAIIITLRGSPDSIQLEISAVDSENGHSISEVGSCVVPVEHADVLSVSCSKTGYLTLLTYDGLWHSFQMEQRNTDLVALSTSSKPLHLAGFSFISSSRSTNSDVSLLALSSSHVLLAAVATSAPTEITLHLWDLQYSVLLASNTITTPSSSASSKESPLSLDLVSASDFQAVLVVSPNLSITKKSQTNPSRSSVFVIPFTLPSVSTIANAMGKASAGAKWIQQSQPQTPESSDPPRSKMLANLRAALEKNLPQAADVAFFEWEKRENVASTAVTPSSSQSHLKLDYAFVKELLALVLCLDRPANTPYSSKIPRYLLNKRVVSSNMVQGGLLRAFRLKTDWESIKIALNNVQDLTEDELMETLEVVVSHHRSNEPGATSDTGAMQIDAASNVPSVKAFLALCVVYPTTSADLRASMRRFLREAEDVIIVMQSIEDWINQWGKRDIRLLPTNKDIHKNENGVFVMKDREREVHRDLPPLLKVLIFLQTLLDASFIALLQYPNSRLVLQKISSHLEPEITSLETMEQLRGFLEPYVKAQEKAIKEASEDKRKQPVVDWRRRRKQAHEQAGLSVGSYQLEELVL